MVGTTSIDVNAAASTPVVSAWVEGDPKQFVLRGNAECERLMGTLQSLGVVQFDYVFWVDSFGDADCVGQPFFKDKGVRITKRHLEAVKQAQHRLSTLLRDALEAALKDCDCADGMLLVRFRVSLGSSDHGIIAFVQVIESISQLEGGDPLHMV